MRPTFYNGAKATIVVYDLTREETLNNVNEWIDDISNYCGPLPTVCFANKSDLIDQDAYDSTQIDKIAEERKFLKVYKTSAKTGKNVHDAFNFIIEHLVKQAMSD